MTAIEKSAFQFVQKAKDVDTIVDLEALFIEFTSPHGVQFHMIGQLIMPGGAVKTTLLFDCSHSEWFRQYKKNYYFLDDPAARISKEAFSPYTWNWILKHVDLSKAEQKVFEEARRFGMTEGIVFPFHGPRGSLGGATVAGNKIKTEPTEIAGFQMMAYAAYLRALTITKLFEDNTKSVLTQRQRECINWAQYGKNNAEIGGILGISPHTVKEHIEAAKKTFGVTSRIEAILQARDCNLISFSPPSDRSNWPPCLGGCVVFADCSYWVILVR